ncbi:hypothetical protein QBC38DRAFT_448152 [Podospora fimiseda]|uniref:Uncharacterized protein n=1 Tax=Podospora fimiseda TaxID=252190 RepID=A0AAN7BFW5_9PEZI|nr:hypothetical protein QBC38DRAFT_448152 [Podospora fimiseda]
MCKYAHLIFLGDNCTPSCHQEWPGDSHPLIFCLEECSTPLPDPTTNLCSMSNTQVRVTLPFICPSHLFFKIIKQNLRQSFEDKLLNDTIKSKSGILYTKISLFERSIRERFQHWFYLRLVDLKQEYIQSVWKYLRLKTAEERRIMIADTTQFDLVKKLKRDVNEAIRIWNELMPELGPDGEKVKEHELGADAIDFFWKPWENPMIEFLEKNWNKSPYENLPSDLRRSGKK